MSPTKLDRRTFTGAAVLLTVMPAIEAGASLAAPPRRGDMVVRPFAAADRDAVSNLVTANYGSGDARTSSLEAINRALHLSDGAGPGFHRTIVGELRGEVVGVASGMSTPLHPAARVHVIVDSGHRRQGAGTQLFHSITRQVRAETLQVIATILGTEEAAWPFARACGMHSLMHARQIKVDPRSWAVEKWTRAMLDGKADFRLVPGPTFPPGKMYTAIGDAYYEMHRRWIATRRLEPDQARSIWEGKISPAHAALALHGEKVIGAAALIASEDKRAILFPAGACFPMSDIKAERRLVGGLIADRLIAARSAGLTEILIESDEDDGRMLEVLGSIPATGLTEIFTLTMGMPGHWPRPLA
jgi:GNAT superfamily N-acetyltransferase